MRPDQVAVTIVTRNSAWYIRPCLEAVLAQEGVSVDVVVVDNASADSTLGALEGFGGRVRVMRNAANSGFAAAQNQAIQSAAGEWVLVLNPDVLIPPSFLARLTAAGSTDPRIGSVCGKLLSIGRGFTPLAEPRIDSAGIYFTPELRHFDRGWSELDAGQYNRREYVFGASAAAALYRRSMIEDVAIGGAFFDPDFFAYREDADVAWRAQLLGWSCRYAPEAVAHHVRTVTPDNRKSVPPLVNMHSVKNRFLMRVKNATPNLYRRFWGPMTARDVMVIGGCLFREPRSLAAFWHLGRCIPRAWRARREIMTRRTASDEAIARWFGCESGKLLGGDFECPKTTTHEPPRSRLTSA